MDRVAKFILSDISITKLVRSRPAKAKFTATYNMYFEGESWPLTVHGTAQFDAPADKPILLDFHKIYETGVRHHQVHDLLTEEEMGVERLSGANNSICGAMQV